MVILTEERDAIQLGATTFEERIPPTVLLMRGDGRCFAAPCYAKR
jgi:hypothetical protein